MNADTQELKALIHPYLKAMIYHTVIDKPEDVVIYYI